MAKRVLGLLRHPVAKNAIALSWVQLSLLGLPLITLPYLARVLGPSNLGVLVSAQALGWSLVLFLDYGFPLSASREIAQAREPGRIARVVTGVQSAKLVLATGALVVSVLLASFAPGLRDRPGYLMLGAISGVIQGMNPHWYFTGIELNRVSAWLQVGSRTSATIGVLTLVQQADQGWLVLVLWGVTEFIAAFVAFVIMYRAVPLSRPRLRDALFQLRRGWPLFVYNGGIILYTTVNAFLLSFFTSSTQVAYFGSAERVSRAAARFPGPICNALYPRISRMVADGRTRAARRVASRTLVGLTAGGLLLGGVLVILAPAVVEIVLGPDYRAVVPILRVLCLLIPLTAISVGLVTWMLPLGLDRAVSRVILIAAIVNVALLSVLGTRFGAAGAVVAPVAAEVIVVVGYLTILWRNGLLPSARARPLSADFP